MKKTQSRFQVSKAVLLQTLGDFFRVPAFRLGFDPAPPLETTEAFAALRNDFKKGGFVPVGEEDGALVIAGFTTMEEVRGAAIS